MHGKELLEELVQMRGVAFISDLHALLWTDETVQAVTAIPDDQFALEEWNEALQYKSLRTMYRFSSSCFSF